MVPRALGDLNLFQCAQKWLQGQALQLSSIDRVERALALCMVVAWRVTYLMRMGRTFPDLDAAPFFDPDEIRGVHLLTKKKMPATPPTLNEVGGFLGRKSDGESGVKTIWRGLRQVHAAAETLRALRDGLG